MAGKIDARLAELGVTLPDAPAPAANYVPYVVSGNMVFISGQVSRAGGEEYVGKVGQDISQQEGERQLAPVRWRFWHSLNPRVMGIWTGSCAA